MISKCGSKHTYLHFVRPKSMSELEDIDDEEYLFLDDIARHHDCTDVNK